MQKLTVSAVLLAAMIAAPAIANGPITGQWVTPEKDAVITISQCGATLCGKLSKYLVIPEGGADQRDVNNPDKALRSRKLLGTPLLSSLKADGKKFRGTIYDPRNGRSYRSIVTRHSPTQLKVQGCLGPICQSQYWTKAN
jgi:uncharacterized protein (DUF2147 family)